MSRNRDLRTVQNYVDYLNKVCNHTITDSRLIVVHIRQQPFYLVACLQDKIVLPLKLKSQGWLHFRQLVRIQSGKVIIEDCGYRYSLSPDPDDEEKWIFRYEYCLYPEEDVPHAHLHLNASRGTQDLRHIHFPTGRVSIEQIIAHLIIEHGVEPKEPDWFAVLAESHKGFTTRRTDPQSQLFP